MHVYGPELIIVCQAPIGVAPETRTGRCSVWDLLPVETQWPFGFKCLLEERSRRRAGSAGGKNSGRSSGRQRFPTGRRECLCPLLNPEAGCELPDDEVWRGISRHVGKPRARPCAGNPRRADLVPGRLGDKDARQIGSCSATVPAHSSRSFTKPHVCLRRRSMNSSSRGVRSQFFERFTR